MYTNKSKVKHREHCRNRPVTHPHPQTHMRTQTHSIPVVEPAFVANFVIIYFGCTQYALIILGVPGRLDNHKPSQVLENIINHLLSHTCVNGYLHDGVWITLMCWNVTQAEKCCRLFFAQLLFIISVACVKVSLYRIPHVSRPHQRWIFKVSSGLHTRHKLCEDVWWVKW